LIVSGVSSDLSRTPAVTNYHLCGFHSQVRNILICSVGYTHSLILWVMQRY
jgi:hypothetical protein